MKLGNLKHYFMKAKVPMLWSWNDIETKIKAAEAEAAAGNSSRRETERSLAAELLEVAGQK